MAVVQSPDDFSPSNIAAQWWWAGCSVIPIRTDGSKRPWFSWRVYQETPAEKIAVRHWFERQYADAGVAVICGQVSGNLEMLELEGRAYTSEILASIRDSCDEETGLIWDRLLTSGYSEVTPSGGLHLLYRVTDSPVPGNEKVASRAALEEEYTALEKATRENRPEWVAVRVLAETRGEGGYVIVAPTSGQCHPTGKPWVRLTGTPADMLNLTWEERCRVHAVIKEVLHRPPPQEMVRESNSRALAVIPSTRVPGAPLSVAEDFNTRSSWEDSWFTEQGWRIHHREGDEIFWTRPGKDWGDGHSATTGMRQGEADCLYVWSTSTTLQAEKPLTKFQVFAHYKFGGDMSGAARSLQRQGYGQAPLAPTDFRPVDIEFGGGDDPADAGHLQPHHLDVLYGREEGNVVLTDSGYALRMKDAHQGELRYNSTEKCWYSWQPGIGIWIRDDYSYVDVAAHNVAQNTYDWVKSLYDQNVGGAHDKICQKFLLKAVDGLNNARLVAAVARFRTLNPVAATTDDFDASVDLLNLRNGTLNLATYQVRPHDSRDMITLTCNAAYDPDAKCPDFERYINDVIPDEDLRAYVQRALGYSLLGRPVERTMFLLHGPSGTGKSVLTDVMTYMFGDYGVTAPSTTFKQKKNESTFDLHRLRGKRFVTTSEMPEGAQLDEELVKRITGGDVIPSRGLYEKFQDWRAQCVIWIATNFLPKLNGDDNAIWRRIRTIPMRTEIGFNGKEEIKGLSALLQTEADGILNWVLDGLSEYRRIGLAEPNTVLEDIATYRTEIDSVASWLAYGVMEGTLVLDPEAKMMAMTAYSSYMSSCQENGINHLGKKRFVKRLFSLNNSIQSLTVSGQVFVIGLRQA